MKSLFAYGFWGVMGVIAGWKMREDALKRELERDLGEDVASEMTTP